MSVDRHAQRLSALEQSHQARQVRTRWRRALKYRQAMLADALTQKPAGLEQLTLIELLGWLPGWGHARVRALNSLAIQHQINLLTTIGEVSEPEIAWLVPTVDSLNQEPRRTLKRRMEEEMTASPTVMWRDTAELLALAISEHQRMVASPEAPAEAFGQADAVLYQTCQHTMENALLAEQGPSFGPAPSGVASPRKVDAAPFVRWLRAHKGEQSAEALACRCALPVDQVRALLNGKDTVISIDRVQQAVLHEGSAQFTDVYPEKEVLAA